MACTIVLVVFHVASLVFICLPGGLTQQWLQGDSVAGRTCYTALDCGARARCVQGVCTCLSSTFVQVANGTCLPKVKPGQTPCWVDEQCQAVWPSTRCVNTICQCMRGVPVRTRDGIVCVEYRQCPLGGGAALLRDQSGRPAECVVNDVTGVMSGCLNQMHMYDCIRDSATAQSQFYCCPNKANTCSQPMDAGTQGEFGGTVQRWYYDDMSRQCRAFSYLGSGGNSNNFDTLQQCDNYCGSTCSRGSPMFERGDGGLQQQFVQKERSCDPNAALCSPQYSCDVIQPGRALCCPSRDFICSDVGGATLDQRRTSNAAFDEGVSCSGAVMGAAITRWYYDRNRRECVSFQYKGCGGNFNNFATKNACDQFCIIGLPPPVDVSLPGLFGRPQVAEPYIYPNPYQPVDRSQNIVLQPPTDQQYVRPTVTPWYVSGKR